MVTNPGLLKRDRDFRWFWSGHTISAFGTQITAVALPLVAVLTLHSDAAEVAAISTAAFLPNVIFPLVVGHRLEHRRRRNVMIGSDIARALLLAVVPLAYVAGVLSVPLLAVVAFLAGAAGVVFDTGSFAYVPNMVDEVDLPAANRAVQGSRTASEIAGPGIAGVLVNLLGPAIAVLADAVSYVASAIGVAAAKRPEPAPPAPDLEARFWDGLRPVVTNPFLRALTVHAATYNMAWQIFSINLVVYMVTDRGLNAGLFGLALSASGVGAFIGTMAALRLARALGYGKAFASALAFSTGVPLLIALLPGRGAGLAAGLAVCQLAAGFGLGIANVLSLTLRQIVAPKGSLTRTGAGYRLIIYGVIPLGSALGGLIGSTLGSQVAVAAGSAGMALSTIPMTARPIRGLAAPEDARQPRPFAASAPAA
ncbi:MFS transporter [Micromonospora sp. NPDC005305]|uniref:MFS transporter n=1 Tax=Micromonospora sp. NPDC005305 TaxID=3156875 RepID=UPI0033A8242C